MYEYEYSGTLCTQVLRYSGTRTQVPGTQVPGTQVLRYSGISGTQVLRYTESTSLVLSVYSYVQYFINIGYIRYSGVLRYIRYEYTRERWFPKYTETSLYNTVRGIRYEYSYTTLM